MPSDSVMVGCICRAFCMACCEGLGLGYAWISYKRGCL